MFSHIERGAGTPYRCVPAQKSTAFYFVVSTEFYGISREDATPSVISLVDTKPGNAFSFTCKCMQASCLYFQPTKLQGS